MIRLYVGYFEIAGRDVPTREEALALIKANVSKRTMLYHMLAVEAIMNSLARYLGEDAELWGLAGILHDIDFERTEKTPENHGLVAEEILNEKFPSEIIRAIKAHNPEHTKIKPETKMEKALIACDAISGLLVACALVMPSKKLKDVKAESVIKKINDKDFARGADRNRIALCEEVGIPKEKFIEIALNGLMSIADEIGL